jgi:hypothetical protein
MKHYIIQRLKPLVPGVFVLRRLKPLVPGFYLPTTKAVGSYFVTLLEPTALVVGGSMFITGEFQ